MNMMKNGSQCNFTNLPENTRCIKPTFSLSVINSFESKAQQFSKSITARESYTTTP